MNVINMNEMDLTTESSDKSTVKIRGTVWRIIIGFLLLPPTAAILAIGVQLFDGSMLKAAETGVMTKMIVTVFYGITLFGYTIFSPLSIAYSLTMEFAANRNMQNNKCCIGAGGILGLLLGLLLMNLWVWWIPISAVAGLSTAVILRRNFLKHKKSDNNLLHATS